MPELSTKQTAAGRWRAIHPTVPSMSALKKARFESASAKPTTETVVRS